MGLQGFLSSQVLKVNANLMMKRSTQAMMVGHMLKDTDLFFGNFCNSGDHQP